MLNTSEQFALLLDLIFLADNQKENKDSKSDNNFNIQRQFQHFKCDMIRTLV